MQSNPQAEPVTASAAAVGPEPPAPAAEPQPDAEPVTASAAAVGPSLPTSAAESTRALAAAEPVTEPAAGDKIPIVTKKRISVAEISPLPSAPVLRLADEEHAKGPK